MRILCILIFNFLLLGCNTVQVAKEVSKVSSSIKTSYEKILEKNSKTDKIDNVIEQKEEEIKTIEKEKEILEKEKIKEKKIVKEQKKNVDINFLGKKLNEIQLSLGKPYLNRIDGNTQMVRFDNSFCKIFIFFNSSIDNAKAKHFEVRNKMGGLINKKNQIEKCYKGFKLI